MYVLKRDLSGWGCEDIKEKYASKAEAIDVFLKEMELQGEETQESIDEMRSDLEKTGKTSIIGCGHGGSIETVVTVRKVRRKKARSLAKK